MCSALTGSGVDICAFSVLVMLFRVTERVATPTSILLMAVNTLVGFSWRHWAAGPDHPIPELAWRHFAVCGIGKKSNQINNYLSKILQLKITKIINYDAYVFNF